MNPRTLYQRIRDYWYDSFPGTLWLVGIRGYLAQRKLDKARLARYEVFVASRGYHRVNGKLVKKP